MLYQDPLFLDLEEPKPFSLPAMDPRLCRRFAAQAEHTDQQQIAVSLVKGDVAIVNESGDMASIMNVFRDQAV